MAEKYDEEKFVGSGNGLGQPPSNTVGGTQATKGPWTQRFVDSFRRDPNAVLTRANETVDPHTGKPVAGFDHAAAAERTANSGLARKLKGRHMQMIAIGGSIGELYREQRA